MPTSDSRDRRASDLRSRAALVRENGWGSYQSAWSTDEVIGTRAVLGEPGVLTEAVEVWAPTLWGVGAAEADARTGYKTTRRWFAAVRGYAALDVLQTAAGKVRVRSKSYSLDEVRARIEGDR